MSKYVWVAAVAMLAIFLNATWAQEQQTDTTLELAVPFTDNMILQRQMKVPIWGFDKPGGKVTVEFADQKKTAVANDEGDWRVDLNSLQASKEPRTFKVSNDRGESITLNNVLVGEVWFASGQSNMVWVAGKSMVSTLANGLRTAEQELPIREININTVSAIYPQKKATASGGWRTCREAMQFSALSLAFAYDLYKELNVPIGILLSAHSNTRVEAFASRESFEAHPALESDVELIHLGDPLTDKGREAFEQYYRDLKAWERQAIEISEQGGDIPGRPNLPGIAGMWRGPSQFFSGKINPVVPYAVRGAIWCQGTSNSSDGKIYAARMEALVNGWREAWDMSDMPFYFTQMQAYGMADASPDNVGFADIRQAQFVYFLNNRDHVGMVVQTDLNSARPQGIHYWNKLHPGMRLARWALHNEYGKDIAYTGPIYAGYKVEGDKVIVSFEKNSLFGGLMVGSKGMAADYREPGKFVEPAKPTPGDKLNHFRLCGKDRKWHAAEAKIVGDTVVVTSKDVPNPVGVQYAYNAVPMNSNLYNKAGLPATPFAAIDGDLIFQEDEKARAMLIDANELIAQQGAGFNQITRNNHNTVAAVRPHLHIANYLRDGVILQRDQPIPVWGHANPGAEVTVKLGDNVKSTTANELEQWSLQMPAMPAATEPITLTIETNIGAKQQVNNILIGDVWYITGSPTIGEMAYDPRQKDAKVPDPLPLVREFRRKTKASTDTKPRKRRFETGGGKYRSHWLPADYQANPDGVTMFAYQFAKALDRQGIPQGFITMPSGREMASPLSWTSYVGVKDITNPAFEARMNELMLQYPDSNVAKKALNQYIADVQADVNTIETIATNNGDLSEAPRRFPQFPTPGSDPNVQRDAIPTYTYNWCVSPLTPMAVAGVIWVPSPTNLGGNPAEYAAEMEIYAKSLPATYGQEYVPLIYAQPTAELVEGITEPDLPNAKKITLNTWPKSLKELARQMAAQVGDQ